ncbi:YcaO-like family protein [Halorubellus litoreus]|uniref:YcaO-like family protein n=1 Tax=Halorubellus litoreus TaxID=755308 RepID=A0ABD5VPK4_9EURY
MNVETTDHPAARAERALGRLTSPVTNLAFQQPDRGTGDFAIADPTVADIERVVPNARDDPIELTVGGGGTTTSAATLSAVGEFLERYAMYWPLGDTVGSTHAKLVAESRRVVDLASLQVYAPAALAAAGYEPFDADTSTEWVRGTTLTGGADALVPVDCVSFTHAHRDGATLPASTSGTACGSTLAGALARALYEQVERDAVMRTWYERRTPTRLDIAALGALDAFRERITPRGSRIELLELPTPTDCRVVATAVVADADRVPKFRLFAGAARTLPDAVRDALAETAEGLLQTRYRLAAGDAPDPDIDIDAVYDFDRNVQYYMRPENYPEVAHLTAGDVRAVDPTDLAGHENAATDGLEGEDSIGDDPRRELERALDAVTANEDVTPIAVDLTPGDVRDLGMYVAAVHVPELVDVTPPALAPVHHPALDEVATRATHPFP